MPFSSHGFSQLSEAFFGDFSSRRWHSPRRTTQQQKPWQRSRQPLAEQPATSLPRMSPAPKAAPPSVVMVEDKGRISQEPNPQISHTIQLTNGSQVVRLTTYDSPAENGQRAPDSFGGSVPCFGWQPPTAETGPERPSFRYHPCGDQCVGRYGPQL